MVKSGSSDATSVKLRKLIPRCPICRTSLDGHRYAQIAVTVANEIGMNRVEELLRNFRQHRWREVTKFKDFSPQENAIISYVMTGPHAGGTSVLIRDPS